METPVKDSSDLNDFLKELDADFGKKGRKYKQGNSARLQSPRGPRDPSEINYASFARRQLAQYLTEGQPLEVGTKAYEPKPNWIPVARVTYICRQRCTCCGNTSEFIGGEYIRFTSTRSHAVITRRAEVCPDLWHYLPDSGDPLPDLVDEFDQTVARCPGCIAVERMAADIWAAATQPKDTPQMELDIPGLDSLETR